MNNSEHNPKGIMPNLPLWSYQLQRDSKLALKTRKDLEVHLITRALRDEEFRNELIANPKAMVEQELGVKLPEELEIKVLEETEDTIYIVLPCNPYEGMSEEELQASLGMTYEDVAQWVLEQQRNVLVDEISSIILIAKCWRDDTLKQEFIRTPATVIEKIQNNELIQKKEDIILQALSESKNSVYIVLPQTLDNIKKSKLDLDELSQLAMIVASGTCCGCNTIACQHTSSTSNSC